MAKKSAVGSVGKAAEDKGLSKRPKIWFHRCDFFYDLADGKREMNRTFCKDMLTRWENPEIWENALTNTDVYSIHERLFDIDGKKVQQGFQFLIRLNKYFNTQIDEKEMWDNRKRYAPKLHNLYLNLILPVLHKYKVKLLIHTIGSKGKYVPWNMVGDDGKKEKPRYPKNTAGFVRVKETISLINKVAVQIDSNFGVSYVKLQSTLSGNWKRGSENNVTCALEYMRAVNDWMNEPLTKREKWPTISFFLGDALERRRDIDKNFRWEEAYTLFHHKMKSNNDYRDIYNRFKGIRIEFNKNWADDTGEPPFEKSPGWDKLSGRLSGNTGAVKLLQGFGWEVGLEHNHPFAVDEQDYQRLVLRTAEILMEREKLRLDFAVLHTDAAGGKGDCKPYNVIPEKRGKEDPPTFSSVLNVLVAYYEVGK